MPRITLPGWIHSEYFGNDGFGSAFTGDLTAGLVTTSEEAGSRRRFNRNCCILLFLNEA